MPRYAVIDKQTGAIKRIVAGPSIMMLRRNVRGGEEALRVGPEVSDATHRYDYAAGRLVPCAPLVTVDDIKRRAHVLISATDWHRDRAVDREDTETLTQLRSYRQAVRQASDALEALDPIPADYADPRHWPQLPETMK